MRKNRKQEYIMIAVINILFLLYTSVFMYGTPYALYDFFTTHTYLTVLEWALYAGSMYLILIWSEGNLQDKGKHLGIALLIGTGTAIAKVIVDVLTNHLLSYIAPANFTNTMIKGVRNGVIGFLFIYFLFHFFSKGKCRLSNTTPKQEKAFAIVIACYILVLILIQFMISFNASVFGADSFNMYSFMELATIGVKEINGANKWFFTIVMIMTWWLVRTWFEEDSEIGKGK